MKCELIYFDTYLQDYNRSKNLSWVNNAASHVWHCLIYFRNLLGVKYILKNLETFSIELEGVNTNL